MGTRTLVGLPGVKRKKVRAWCPSTRSEAERLLKDRKPITAAGSKGAINVWFDDQGTIQAEYMQYGATMGRLSTNVMAAVKRWLAKWWSRLETV